MARAVTIETLAEAHAPALQVLAEDTRIAATTLVPYPYPPGAAQEFAGVAARARRDRTAFSFAVLAGGEVVGSCGLKHLDRGALQGEIGYWIGVPHWGRGYAAGAVELVTAYGFGPLGLRRIVAEVLDGNAASARILEKRGYRPVTRFRNPHPRHEGRPTSQYALDRESLKPRGLEPTGSPG